MDKTIVVDTELGKVTVRKLALGDYAELLRALKKLPQEIGKVVGDTDAKDLQDTAKIMEFLPTIIADALPEFCDVMAITTDKDSDFIIKLDLADAVDVFGAALELNDYQRVANSIKKIMARRKPTQESQEAPKEPTQ